MGFFKFLEEILGFDNKPTEVNEGIFDTDFFKSRVSKYGEVKRNLTDAERERIKDLFSIPDARPGDFDGTFSAWLLRISLWGKIRIRHIDPEKNINRILTEDQFLDYIDDKVRNSYRGLWTVEEVEINIIRFYRNFFTFGNRTIKEEIIVDIDLRPDLKAVLKKARRGF